MSLFYVAAFAQDEHACCCRLNALNRKSRLAGCIGCAVENRTQTYGKFNGLIFANVRAGVGNDLFQPSGMLDFEETETQRNSVLNLL